MASDLVNSSSESDLPAESLTLLSDIKWPIIMAVPKKLGHPVIDYCGRIIIDLLS